MTSYSELLETPAALDGIEPLATAVAETADGVFTVRVFPGATADMVTVVVNLDDDGDGEPHGTTLEGETAQEYADYRAASFIRARGAAR